MRNEEIKYFAYCRKSSEDTHKQVASIGDQVSTVSALIEREELNLVHIPFTEEKSAKQPGRLIFNEMLDRIERGEANGIVCWAINRLYRNPVDEGRLRWMLQKGVIKMIKTPSREFYPDDAGLLMGVEGGQATDYVIRLSKDVKRGLNGKAAKGWRPSPGPIGYNNIGDVGDRTIIPDPKNFELVRKMWDLFLTGTYSVSKIRDMANNEWGLRTEQRRKLGGNPLTMSHMYTIFNNPFYFGRFWWVNPETGERELYKGKHVPMITENEYRRAQVLLGKKGKPQAKTREFSFTGLMRCGECSSSITAEEKNQVICTKCKTKFAYDNKTACSKCGTDILNMTNPTILHYVYYHCTKKKNRSCSQGSVRIEELERQFTDVLKGLTIDQDYLILALDYLKDKQVNAGSEESSRRSSLQEVYDNCQTRLKNLSREFISPQNAKHEIYTSEEYAKEKAEIIKERDGIELELNSVKGNLDKVIEATERTFNFCAFALCHFNTEDLQKKRNIFSTIGSNLILKDKKLLIERLHPYLLIENELKAQRTLYEALEPKMCGYTKRKKEIFTSSIPNWLRGLDAVRTAFLTATSNPFSIVHCW